MEFALTLHIEKRKKADVLVLPFWKGTSQPEAAIALHPLKLSLDSVFNTGDFKGKEGETLFLYVEGLVEMRVALLGLGEKNKVSTEALRKSYGCLAKACLGKKLKTLNILMPEFNKTEENAFIKAITEGLLLPNYVYDRLKSKQEEDDEETLLQKINFISSNKHVLALAEEVAAICDGVYYTRDLINGNADEITPQYLAKCAQGLSQEYSQIKTTVFDKKRLEKEQMGLLLAVNRGSNLDPALIIMEYKGNPKSKDHTVIIGKGVTYDTGGLNIKPTGGIETMKCDMSGGAACFGTMLAACHLDLKVNLTAIIPATENSVDAASFKPGDVYRSYLGKTVEMTNSDAEGRLILADALAYASQNLKPSRLIDIATLTGAIEISLGSEASGLMSTDDQLAKSLIQAGENTYERLWRMPLYEGYQEKLKSDIADLKSWNGRSGSSCVAAMFLKNFVGKDIPWAHLDIAGTAYVTEPKKYMPKYASGVGVRLLVEFLKQLSMVKN
ncbi:leucyl aminopeptidase [Candidatus Protochlamydia sp. R18]|uniref:leucyl aminopeptidase n=1 Tax=Candidatus Protochlamydia sp. R18 TaxID=1353977 RepID=UPI0005A861CF|nr:leucyl aminopeptidase [Candidatus Protochlamydia sp. R18]